MGYETFKMRKSW